MDVTLDQISRVRTAVAWARRTGRPMREYPRIAGLTTREAFDATAFATGNYPLPARWTKRVYAIARGD